MKVILVHLFVVFCTFSIGLAASLPAERVQFKDGKVVIWPGGAVLKAPDEIQLPFSVVIQTNGMFTVKDGKVRTLKEGESLGADGMLTKPDGTIAPVMDHVTLNRGRVILFKDGIGTELRESLQLADGSTILPEGKISPRGSSPRMLLDGELFKLDGGALPTRDSITLQNGHVMVQKDGAKKRVEPNRSMMMNDGTKVQGDGTVIKFNGDKLTLREGQIITLDGVTTRPR